MGLIAAPESGSIGLDKATTFSAYSGDNIKFAESVIGSLCVGEIDRGTVVALLCFFHTKFHERLVWESAEELVRDLEPLETGSTPD